MKIVKWKYKKSNYINIKMTKFYYKVLDISETATDTEIKNAYKKLAKKWHPDKNLDNRKRAEQMFNIISEAYQILSNNESRKLYDQNININNKIQDPFDLFDNIFQKTRLRRFSKNNDEMVLFNPFNRLMSNSFFSDSFFNNDSFFNDNVNSNSYFTSSSTIIRNGKKDTKVKRGYIKDGQRIVEEKHIYTDKDGKLKEDKKVRRKPVNMKYAIGNR